MVGFVGKRHVYIPWWPSYLQHGLSPPVAASRRKSPQIAANQGLTAIGGDWRHPPSSIDKLSRDSRVANRMATTVKRRNLDARICIPAFEFGDDLGFLCFGRFGDGNRPRERHIRTQCEIWCPKVVSNANLVQYKPMLRPSENVE